MASQTILEKNVNESGNLDLELLVQDVQAIVSSALKDKLKRVYEMNREYKQTHDAVMQIPAVRKLVHPSNIHDVTCEEMQRLIAENASLKAKVSELEHSILKMMDSQDAHFTSLEPEPENITLVIEETEEIAEDESVDSDDDDEIDIAALAALDSIANDHEEEEEEEEEEADSAENEETVITRDSEEEEEEEVEEDEQEILPGIVTVHREETESNQDVDGEEDEEEEEETDSEEEVEMNEEVEVIEIEIKGKKYFTTDETSGVIYACTPDGDIGDEVGNFVGGKPVFARK